MLIQPLFPVAHNLDSLDEQGTMFTHPTPTILITSHAHPQEYSAIPPYLIHVPYRRHDPSPMSIVS
jgi:hypothetical protein